MEVGDHRIGYAGVSLGYSGMSNRLERKKEISRVVHTLIGYEGLSQTTHREVFVLCATAFG